ncbi:MAG: hypothetical protein NDI81_15140 [Desulfobacula sp.]|nr:hypothetical protein [Desulfobacula sp.]
MKNTILRLLFPQARFAGLIVMLLIFNTGAASGADIQTPEGYTRSNTLPADFLTLVPKGYAVESPQMVKHGPMGNVTFFAQKKITGRHSIYNSEYHFDLNIKEAPSQLTKTQGPMYRTQLEQTIEKEMSGRHKDDSDPITGYDQARLTRYAWGAGITQRIIHKYMGAGKSPDEIDYSCVYFGLMVDDLSIKQFKLSVSGVETLAEADQWAEKVAEKISRTGLSDLSDK